MIRFKSSAVSFATGLCDVGEHVDLLGFVVMQVCKATFSAIQKALR